MLLRARLSEVSWARPAVSPPVAKIGHNRTRSTKFFFSAMGGRQAVLILSEPCGARSITENAALGIRAVWVAACAGRLGAPSWTEVSDLLGIGRRGGDDRSQNCNYFRHSWPPSIDKRADGSLRIRSPGHQASPSPERLSAKSGDLFASSTIHPSPCSRSERGTGRSAD